MVCDTLEKNLSSYTPILCLMLIKIALERASELAREIQKDEFPFRFSKSKEDSSATSSSLSWKVFKYSKEYRKYQDILCIESHKIKELSETIAASARAFVDKHPGFAAVRTEILSGGPGVPGGENARKLAKRHVEYIKKSVEKQPHLER